MPRYRINHELRPGENLAIGDGKHWVQLDGDMCVHLSADNAKTLEDAGWNIEPYDPIKHAHPFSDLTSQPKSAEELLELIKFTDPQARDAAKQAILMEAARRLKLQEGAAASIQEHDEQVATQQAAAASMAGHHERVAQEAATGKKQR